MSTRCRYFSVKARVWDVKASTALDFIPFQAQRIVAIVLFDLRKHQHEFVAVL